MNNPIEIRPRSWPLPCPVPKTSPAFPIIVESRYGTSSSHPVVAFEPTALALPKTSSYTFLILATSSSFLTSTLTYATPVAPHAYFVTPSHPSPARNGTLQSLGVRSRHQEGSSPSTGDSSAICFGTATAHFNSTPSGVILPPVIGSEYVTFLLSGLNVRLDLSKCALRVECIVINYFPSASLVAMRRQHRQRKIHHLSFLTSPQS